MQQLQTEISDQHYEKKKTMSFARAPKINNPKITPLAEHVSVVVVMHDQKKTMSLFCA